MKAPDKIYIEIRHPISTEYTEIIGFDTPEKNTIKYIRKDALLEWAKKEMGEWSYESNTAQGVKMGITLVLDKINSL